MIEVAALVAPVARWHDEYGLSLADVEVRAALTRGAPGVLVTDGPLEAIAAAIRGWRSHAARPIFVAAELGAGVGERFDGGTALPPLAAFEPTQLDAIRRAAVLTAREARAAGITWALAPSCVDPALAAPIVASRTLRGDASEVAAAVAEWIDACQAESVVATPGPYPLMHAASAGAALDTGAGAMLLATSEATHAEVVRYLRDDAAFAGVIVAPIGAIADALGEDEDVIAVECVLAGCDLLLGAEEPVEVERALRAALRDGLFDEDALQRSVARVQMWTGWSDPQRLGRAATLDDALWARRIADEAIQVQRGQAHALRDPVEVVVIDDDPPRRVAAGSALVATLHRLGHDVTRVVGPSPVGRGSVVVAVFGDRRIALGFDQYSDGALAQVAAVLQQADRMGRDAVVLHFTPPDLTAGMEAFPVLVCAWSGTAAMEEAAARWLARSPATHGSVSIAG